MPAYAQPAYFQTDSTLTTHVYGALKGMYPINTQWGVFAKVGYDYMTVNSVNNFTSTINPMGVLLAAGGSYQLNESMSLTLAYNQVLDSYTKNGSSMNVDAGYGSLGLTYLF